MLARSSLLINSIIAEARSESVLRAFSLLAGFCHFSRSTSNLNFFKFAGVEVSDDLKIVLYSSTSARKRACNSGEPCIRTFLYSFPVYIV